MGGPPTPSDGEPWTPILLTRWSGAYLERKGVENGRLEAELLLAGVLGVKRLDLYLQYDRPMLPEELERFKALLKRRASREPLQHILGTTTFRELELRTDRRALIPRPETEVLVEEVLAWSRSTAGSDGGLTALDLGTGSGAIALSLLAEGPFSRVVGTDASGEALSLARENAETLEFPDGLLLREGSLFTPLGQDERFHVIVSNPPYVTEAEGETLEPEVRDWEPLDALLAGPEGLDVLLPIVRGARSHLLPGGLLALEVGSGQAGRVVRALEEEEAYREIRVRPDLAGRDRVVLGVA